MLLTVAYGIYTLFFEGKVKSSSTPAVTISASNQLEDLNAFISKVAEASQAGLSKEDKYIISRAEAAWKQDPLTTVELTNVPENQIKRQKQVADSAGPQLNVSYTGFMQMGDKKFAVINGLEYTTGDELIQGGYVVGSITQSQVVIISTGRNKKRFVFPLEE